MGITGLIPFLEKASRKTSVSEFSGCTVAIDSYCWLHKGAFACADKLARGEETDVHINYCLKYVTMLLSKNIKPILVFDGRHLPAKALTELKRRESRDTSRKRAAELLRLGKTEEARSYIRRCVDITHQMALALIKECRKRNVDCIVAPYEADAQLAYLNVKNYAQVVITEDSDLILFGCTKVLFKMDLEGNGLLVETAKLPLAMKCPIEHYHFDKFRRMCIMSGCDYLASLPGIGLQKARQFVTATQDSNFANALRKLPSFFNKASLTVTDEYRENFLKAEATFKHQYVYDPIEREMLRLNEVDDDDVEQALCVNAGELLDPKIAFQLALGNLEPFTLKKLDNWSPDNCSEIMESVKTKSWKEKGVSSHPSIWQREFQRYLQESEPWMKKVRKPAPIIAVPNTRARKKVVNLVSKYVEETQDQSLTIESLSSMYCAQPVTKKQKISDEEIEQNLTQYTQNDHDLAMIDNYTESDTQNIDQRDRSPILENKERSFKKCLQKGSYSVLKKLSRFPRTILDGNIVESKFFNSNTNTDESFNNSVKEKDVSQEKICDESTEKSSRNPFKLKQEKPKLEIDSQCFEIPDSQLNSSQKENSPQNSPVKRTKTINSIRRSNSPTKSTFDSAISLDSSIKRTNVYKDIDCKSTTDSDIIKIDLDESPVKDGLSPKERSSSPILDPSPRFKNPFRTRLNESTSLDLSLSEDSVIENTYPMETLVTPVDSQASFGSSQSSLSQFSRSQPQKPTPVFKSFPNSNSGFKNGYNNTNGFKKGCKAPGLKRANSLPNNQPTLLSKFGFQKKPVLRKS